MLTFGYSQQHKQREECLEKLLQSKDSTKLLEILNLNDNLPSKFKSESKEILD